MAEAESKTPFLRITELTKKFGAFTALQGISLDVFEGEFVCFLGPSGCGKTTLLRAIAGLDIQTYGKIEQAGKDISTLPPSERDFGIVFQSYALFPNLSVRKNIAYGLENRKTAKADIVKRVNELLELVGLPEQSEKYPAQLSGGQQQRIALARALATTPGLLLLDEPLSALDAKVRVELRREVKQLQERLGVTTIMVTHDQEEALTMADRIVVMNHGVIEQIGSPTEVYGEPTTHFVAEFIGTMNFFAGKVLGDGEIDLAGAKLSASTTGLSDGQSVTVAIRPEDILIQDVKGVEANAFNVNIENMEFLGSFVRAELKTNSLGGEKFLADFSINLLRRLGVESGDERWVVLPPDRIRVFPS